MSLFTPHHDAGPAPTPADRPLENSTPPVMELVYDGKHAQVPQPDQRDNQPLAGQKLQGSELIFTLVDAWRQGVREVHVYPKESQGAVPVAPTCVNLQGLLDEAGLAPESRLATHVSANGANLVKVVLYHCQQCGGVVERRSGHHPPACCGVAMHVAGHDSLPAN